MLDAGPAGDIVKFGIGLAPFDRWASYAAAAGRDPDGLAFVGGLAVGPADAHSARLARGHHVTVRDRDDEERRRVGSAHQALDQVEAARQAGFTHLGVTLSWESVGELRDRLA
jgi:hypothetical protein